MAKFIGIDFGTDKCSMAVLDGESATVIPSPDGEETTPSAVAFTRKGVLVGAPAARQAAVTPEGTIFGVKRLLGRKFHSHEAQWLAGSYPYPVVAAPSGDAHVHVNNQPYSPEEVASFLLEHLRLGAEAHLKESVDAVITVPGWWDELGRRALLAGAKLAGLRVKSLISATSAAALMCGATAEGRQLIAVLDFGAGGFDAALLNASATGAEVLAIAGDPMLGGDDLDRRLVAHWLVQHRERTGEDMSADPLVLQWLRTHARQTKHDLTDRDTVDEVTQALITSAGETTEMRVAAISRSEFTELIRDELARLLDPCRWVFDDALLGTDDVDAVFLVGGLARVPAVQEKVEYLFRRTPRALGNADHIVALGAARYSAALQHGSRNRVDLREVIGTSTGIRISGGQFAPVVRRNHPIPCRETRHFRTARDDQERIVFDVFQGESEVAADNLYVGRFELDGLLGDRNFETAFRLDRNGLLHIALSNPRTRIDKDVPVQRAGGLSDRELAQLRAQRAARMAPKPSERDPAPTPRPERTATTTLTPPQRDLRTKPPQTKPFGSAKGQAPDLPAIEMDDDSLIGSTLGGRYVVEEILGEGGMGRVYRARHAVLDKMFAIKVLHPELASSKYLAHRFIEEARAASSIKSRHVIDISDFGALDDGTGYFVMEYLQGRTLHDVLKDAGRVEQKQLIMIGIQIAEGLSDAHELGVVHRDLKPSNIMIMDTKDGTLRCTILDFGIAKRPTSTSSGAITRSGVMVGTPEYMSPEQIQGTAVDGRADIYALGIMLYELAAGRRPFDAVSQAELLMQQVYEPPPRIHDIAPETDCSQTVEAIILRCIDKDPARRFPTAAELAEAFRSVH